MTALPKYSIRDLLEAGVHFGHRTSRWNPRMAPYIFGERNGIHIIDLQQTAPLLYKALQQIYKVVKKNGRVLFVGTKKSASVAITEEARRCGQYYVNFRWLGGMLTNWNTVSQSINTLRNMNEVLAGDKEGLTKKEILEMSRKRDKLDRSLGGIMDMGGKPDIIFVVDTNKEDIAIAEAKKLGIPVVGVTDTNSDPTVVDYPIPGNDDSIRSVRLYCKLIADSVLAGIQDSLSASGADIGTMEETDEKTPENKKDKQKAKKKAAVNKKDEGKAAIKEKVSTAKKSSVHLNESATKKDDKKKATKKKADKSVVVDKEVDASKKEKTAAKTAEKEKAVGSKAAKTKEKDADKSAGVKKDKNDNSGDDDSVRTAARAS